MQTPFWLSAEMRGYIDSKAPAIAAAALRRSSAAAPARFDR